MTRLLLRALMWLSLLAVVLVAGGHFVYYLLGWEWDRAAIAGIGFVAALVLGVGFLGLARLRAMERRLDQLAAGLSQAGPVAEPAPPTVVPVTAELEPRPDLPWLTTAPGVFLVAVAALSATVPSEPRPAVFIPIFLAAGLLVSGAAAVVERLSAARAGSRQPSAGPPAPRAASPVPLGRLAVAAAVVLVLGGVATGGLFWLSHYWSQPVGPGVTSLTVEVRSQNQRVPDREVVETMGRFCALDAGTAARFRGAEDAAAGRVELRLVPQLDAEAQQRYVGCLEDSLLEWHRLTVVGTKITPR